MIVNQAKAVFRFSRALAGQPVRSDRDDLKQFIFFVIGPIYTDKAFRHILHKMDLADGYSYLNAMIVRFREELGELIEKTIFEFGCDDENQTEEHFCESVEKFSTKLRWRFRLKITELEKSLRSQLRRALSKKDFEHSGQKRVSSRCYWTEGNGHWQEMNEDLITHPQMNGLLPPAPKTKAFPDTETALPVPSDLRVFMLQVFKILNHKLPFSNVLEWLNQYEPYSPAKRIDDPDSPPIETDEDPTPQSCGNDEKLWAQANENLANLKPKYQESFKRAFLWHKQYFGDSSLGYKELEERTAIKKSTMEEHFKKHIIPIVIQPMGQGALSNLSKFREKFSEFNPEKE